MEQPARSDFVPLAQVPTAYLLLTMPCALFAYLGVNHSMIVRPSCCPLAWQPLHKKYRLHREAVQFVFFNVMADQVAVAVSGCGAVAVAGFTKRFFDHIQKDFLINVWGDPGLR